MDWELTGTKSARNRRPTEQEGRRKVFGVGCNKTGTTSLARALRDLGFRVGNQGRAELLLKDWAARNFRPIVEYCRPHDAFQDIPFSLDHTYEALAEAFPGSRFVLTVRRSADEWFDSLVRYHSLKFGGGRIPAEQDLARAGYRYRGWILEVMRHVFDYPRVPLYDRAHYTGVYLRHNEQVAEYFRDRRRDLLVINMADDGSYLEFCEFLGVAPVADRFPWLNPSAVPVR